jgi:hypothetical protein
MKDGAKIYSVGQYANLPRHKSDTLIVDIVQYSVNSHQLTLMNHNIVKAMWDIKKHLSSKTEYCTMKDAAKHILSFY